MISHRAFHGVPHESYLCQGSAGVVSMMMLTRHILITLPTELAVAKLPYCVFVTT